MTYFKGLTGGRDPIEGVEALTGPLKLVLEMAEVFSVAACHKDADQMMRLMSDRLIVKGVVTLEASQGAGIGEDQERLTQVVMTAVAACPTKMCVLKLTNETNHSAVYLIEDVNVPGESADSWRKIKGSTKYETTAGPDSDAILYNDLIRSAVSPAEARKDIAAGIKHVAATYQGAATVRWEVHTATSSTEMERRVDTHLRKGATAFSVGVGVAGHEQRAREALIDSSTRGKASSMPPVAEEELLVGSSTPGRASSMPPVAEEELLVGSSTPGKASFMLPVAEIDEGKQIRICPMRSEESVAARDLRPGTDYRVQYRDRWMKASLTRMAENLTWFGPAAKFRIEAIGPQFARPEEVKSTRSGQLTVRLLDIRQWHGSGQLNFSGTEAPVSVDANLEGKEESAPEGKESAPKVPTFPFRVDENLEGREYERAGAKYKIRVDADHKKRTWLRSVTVERI